MASTPTATADPTAVATVPTTLPFGLAHLSHSSVWQLEACPELFRQQRILKHRTPASTAMIQGRLIDRVLGELDAIVLAGQAWELDDVDAIFAVEVERLLDEEATHRPLPDELDETWATRMLDLARHLGGALPRLGTPIATQPRLELRLSPDASWHVLGYADRIVEHPDGRLEVQDLKVRKRLAPATDAERSTQLATYVGALRQAGRDVTDGAYLQAKPGTSRNGPDHRLDPVRFTPTSLAAVAARYAHAARLLHYFARTYGPDEPWDTRPHGFHCSPDGCVAYRRCPGVLAG